MTRTTEQTFEENPQLQELRFCRKEQTEIDGQIRVLESEIASLTSNKNYAEIRERTQSINLSLLMTKINAEGYQNRYLYSVEENDLRIDQAQAREEARRFEAQMYPIKQKCNELKRKKKLLKKKEKRIQREMSSGLKLSREEETGADNPLSGPFNSIMNLLGTNAFPKFLGLCTVVCMILYSIFC